MIWSFFVTPARLTEQTGISKQLKIMDKPLSPQAWRERLLSRLCVIALVVGVPAVIASWFVLGLSFWTVATIFYLAGILVSYVGNWIDFEKRAGLLIVIPLTNSVAVLMDSGLTAGAHLYAALGVLGAAVLLSTKVSMVIFLATVLMFCVAAPVFYFGIFEPANPQVYLTNDTGLWFWYPFSYAVCLGIAVGSIQFIMQRLSVGWEGLHATTDALKQSHEAELRTLENYRLLANNMTDIVWTNDLELRPVFVGPSIEQLGYTAEDVYEQGLTLILSEKLLQANQERVLSKERVERAATENSPVRWESFLRDAHGQQARFEFISIFTSDADGAPNGVLNVGRNIDNRRRAEIAVSKIVSELQELQDENYFQALVAKFADELQCRMFAVTELERFEGGQPRTLAIWKDGQILENQSYPAIKAPEIVAHCEAPERDELGLFEHFPGGEGMSQYVACPIRVSGKTAGLLLAFHDGKIKQRSKVEWLLRAFVFHTGAVIAREQEKKAKEQIQRQLFQAQKIESVGQLAGGIAHDFNNLLAVIRGNIELAQDLNTTPEQLTQYLDQVNKATDRAASLTQQILTFSRQQFIDAEHADLNKICRELVPMLDRLLGASFALKFEPDVHALPIKVDVAQIDQAIVNLVVNARDAMGETGEVTLQTELCEVDAMLARQHDVKPGRYVRLRVKDNGPGIAPEILDRIFDPYFTTKPVGRGTGFGLAVFSGIVKQHQGFYDVNCPGIGAVFDAYFPYDLEQSTRVVKPRLQVVSGGRESLLVVEDNAELATVVSRTLEQAGYSVSIARSKAEGIDVFEQTAGHIALVLLDVNLGDGTGFEVMRHIRNSGYATPILFTSGYAEDRDLYDELATQQLDLIRKPYKRDELLQRIRDVLDQQIAERLKQEIR